MLTVLLQSCWANNPVKACDNVTRDIMDWYIEEKSCETIKKSVT